MRRLLLSLVLLSAAACGDDDAAGGAGGTSSGGVIPPGGTVPPGELPAAASFVEIKGTEVGIARGFACALTLGSPSSAKKVVCWGEVKYQQQLQLNALGKTGIEIKMPSPPKTTSMGGDGACAITEDGAMRCWGDGIRGNTGAGKIGTPEVGETVSIAGFTAPVDWIGLGDSNARSTCAISAGKPYCWDLGRDEAAKELPGGVTDAKIVAANNGTQCVVRADNKLYCWGANDFSQLGIPIGGTGTSAPPPVTTPTEVPGLTDVTAVQVGGQDVCAVSKGEIYCWGGRWYAGMKDADRAAEVPKTKVAGVANVTKFRRDSSYFCALSGGNAYCSSGSSSTPTALKIEEPGAIDIALSSSTTRCGVFADNRVKCWGPASSINGDGAFAYHPIPTFVPGVTGATKLFTSPGGACALDKDGKASCWGDVARNTSADKAGDGHVERWPALDGATFLTTDSSYDLQHCGVFGGAIKCAKTAADVAPTPLLNFTNVVDFAMVGTAGCAHLADDTLACWKDDKKTPEPVKNLSGVKAVILAALRAGGPMTCILQDGNGVKCWSGQPDPTDGTKYMQNDPAATLGKATELHGGGGPLWCGPVPNGVACDIGPFGPNELKGEIGGTTGATQIAVGENHACAFIGGRVQCWGAGQYGQLGSGNLSQTKAAFPVSNAGTPVAMSAGTDFTCSLIGDGRVQCWGTNATGIVSPPPVQRELPNQVKVIY